MKHLIRLAIFILTLAPIFVRAGGDEVVVVYNKRMPESKAVADYYARMRNVPQKQVYGFSLTTNETMSRAEFHDSLQIPLAKKLESDGLWKFARTTISATKGQPERAVRRVVAAKIRYAVLCYGVPLRIAEDSNLQEAGATNFPSFFRNNGAAVDSELTLLPQIEMNLSLTGPWQNPTYNVTNAAWLNPTNGILLVARLDGPSPDIACSLVDKAVQAERDGLWGRAYFDTRGLKPAESGYFSGDQMILGAAQISRAIGFETVVDDKPATFATDFPMSQIAIYAGWYDENASGPFSLPKVEFMPGAFAYHLHSFSAATIRSATDRWVGPLLAKGATCTMGCVDEPSLQFTPNVALFLERWSVRQFTFGEAAWASQLALSWQTTVVGDPLYRPFKKTPEMLHQELAQRRSPLVEWSFLRLANLNLLRGAPGAQVIDFLENLPATANSAVLTEKLAGLCDAEGKPSATIDFYERALQLNPSPEQKIRLRIALGEKLQAQNRNRDAVENYQKLLEESPDYPGKNSIEEKIKSLEPKSAGTNSPENP
ncbi:MAG TPA: TIGR03790 family protein [Methylomirabilota bacterium]|nr:TIGR03790 family protein [Methylomirabilota bacterium]